jgi:L-ascorbate metabolism protein UlaG (beta-lactamase superfamily)
MKITKFNQSGFYLEKDGRGLLIDPVEYVDGLPEFGNIDVIVISHLHSDHFQPEVLAKIRERNPSVVTFTTEDNAGNIENCVVAKNGDVRTVGAFDLRFYGENHAEIVEGEVPCQNIGVVVDGYFANSADSFDIPPVRPEVLAVPLSAPWLKLSESMKFIEAVKPKVVIPAHDGLNSELGNLICDNWVAKVCAGIGAEYKKVHFGEVEVIK